MIVVAQEFVPTLFARATNVAGARVFMDSCGPAGPMGAGRSACATPRRESLA